MCRGRFRIAALAGALVAAMVAAAPAPAADDGAAPIASLGARRRSAGAPGPGVRDPGRCGVPQPPGAARRHPRRGARARLHPRPPQRALEPAHPRAGRDESAAVRRRQPGRLRAGQVAGARPGGHRGHAAGPRGDDRRGLLRAALGDERRRPVRALACATGSIGEPSRTSPWRSPSATAGASLRARSDPRAPAPGQPVHAVERAEPRGLLDAAAPCAARGAGRARQPPRLPPAGAGRLRRGEARPARRGRPRRRPGLRPGLATARAPGGNPGDALPARDGVRRRAPPPTAHSRLPRLPPGSGRRPGRAPLLARPPALLPAPRRPGGHADHGQSRHARPPAAPPGEARPHRPRAWRRST